MTVYLPGTHTISSFIRGTHPALTQRMAQATQAQTIATSAICRAEVRYGQGLVATNDKRRVPIDLLLHELPTLPWTVAAAGRYGYIQAQFKGEGLPLGDVDTLIAAQALAEGLILVTHNTRHFEEVVGLRVEDWLTT